MKSLRTLLSSEPRARRLLLAHAQSSLGTGAAYVALLLVAYERFHSPFAVSVVLLCELAPAMLLAPLLGALADRWSRKHLLVAADVLRAGAFVALAFAGSFELTVLFALLAGVGQAAFQPAIMASLPTLVARERLSAATGIYGAIQEFGFTAGPVLAAAAFVLVDAPGLLLANGITFALSAALLSTIDFGRQEQDAQQKDGKPGLLTAVGDGARALRANRAAWTIVLSSTAFVCFLGAVNVAELVLVRETLDGGAAGYSLVVAAMGLGVTTGSVLGARAADGASSGRQYLLGLAVCGVSLAATALVPSWPVALMTFALLGARQRPRARGRERPAAARRPRRDQGPRVRPEERAHLDLVRRRVLRRRRARRAGGSAPHDRDARRRMPRRLGRRARRALRAHAGRGLRRRAVDRLTGGARGFPWAGIPRCRFGRCSGSRGPSGFSRC